MARYRPRDHYFQKAKKEGLRARSAFKIDEIARRFSLVRRVVPSSTWERPGRLPPGRGGARGDSGRVVGIDLVPSGPGHLLGDDRRAGRVGPDFLEVLRSRFPGPFDAVLSDLAPKTTGVRVTDQARSVELARRALATRTSSAGRVLRSSPSSSWGRVRSAPAELRQRYGEVKIVRRRPRAGAASRCTWWPRARAPRRPPRSGRVFERNSPWRRLDSAPMRATLRFAGVVLVLGSLSSVAQGTGKLVAGTGSNSWPRTRSWRRRRRRRRRGSRRPRRGRRGGVDARPHQDRSAPDGAARV